MITFKTQEEFEQAVMEVIRNQLKVGVTVRSFGGVTNVNVCLFDACTGDDIDRSSDQG